MKYIKSIILILLITLTTGCWNYRELSELSIVGSIGIDLAENDQYEVSVEITNTKVLSNNVSGGSSSSEAPTVVYSTKAKTINEAISNLVLQTPNELYVGHINLLVLSEEVAKKGLYEIIDYFMADPEIRKIFPTVVVKNTSAKDVIEIITPLETVTATKLKESLSSTKKTISIVSDRQFDEILGCLYMEGRHPTITAIEVFGKPEEGKDVNNTTTTKPKTYIETFGSAVFKKDKFIGYLDKLDSLGYTILRNSANTIDISFPCDEKQNYGSVVIDNVKCEIEVTPNGEVVNSNINISGKGALPEYNCKAPNKDPIKAVKEIEKMVNKEIERIIKTSLIKLQKEYNSDVIGFGEILYKNNYKYWKQHKKNWDEIFLNMTYNIKSKVSVESVDSTVKPAKEG